MIYGYILGYGIKSLLFIFYQLLPIDPGLGILFLKAGILKLHLCGRSNLEDSFGAFQFTLNRHQIMQIKSNNMYR